MTTIRTARVVGTVGALMLPTLAVAALEIPHVFRAGEVVSASEINENFRVLADCADQKPLMFSSRKTGVTRVEPDNTAVNYSSIEVAKPAGVSGQLLINASLSISTQASGATRSIVAYIEESPDVYSGELGHSAVSMTPLGDNNHTHTLNVSTAVPLNAETSSKTYYLNLRENGIGTDIFEVRWARMSALFVPD